MRRDGNTYANSYSNGYSNTYRYGDGHRYNYSYTDAQTDTYAEVCANTETSSHTSAETVVASSLKQTLSRSATGNVRSATPILHHYACTLPRYAPHSSHDVRSRVAWTGAGNT
jgi:hypothetical protein